MGLAVYRKFARAGQRRVHDRPALDARFGQMIGHQIAEIAVAQQQGARLVELAVHLAAELHHAGRHRHGLRRDIGIAAHALRPSPGPPAGWHPAVEPDMPARLARR